MLVSRRGDALYLDLELLSVQRQLDDPEAFLLAHAQGGLRNQSQLAASLAVSGQTVARYIDLLCDLMLVRRLPAWYGNVGKRLVRAPKVYVRDSGLGLADLDAILSHPVAGASWESFGVEQLLAAARLLAG